jgi:hypothetical protein
MKNAQMPTVFKASPDGFGNGQDVQRPELAGQGERSG